MKKLVRAQAGVKLERIDAWQGGRGKSRSSCQRIERASLD